jgi:hypothetical protein
MFVDIWVLALFSLLFGVCAWTSRSAGVKAGEVEILRRLHDAKIIMLENGRIVPYSNKK